VTLAALDGEPAPLLAGRDGEVLVVAFTQVGCPIAQRFGPKLAKLHEQYREQGVAFVGVDASPQDEPAEIAAQAERLKHRFPYLRDEHQVLLRALDVRTSTEVLVLDRERRIRYRGAIDDSMEVGVLRATHERDLLNDAIAAVLAGRVPEVQGSDAPGCVITRAEPRAPASPLPDPVTYSEHVAPILQRSCVPCHREDHVAPFALTSYDDARGWSSMIEVVLDLGLMPPWSMSPHFDGEFANERRLPERDEALLRRWIATGAQEGDPSLAPAPREWPTGWSLTDIDTVVRADSMLELAGGGAHLTPLPREGFRVPADQPLEYQELANRRKFDKEVWVTGIEVRPMARTVVHHIGVFVMNSKARWYPKGDPRRGQNRDEFWGEDHPERLGAGYFALYTPGGGPIEFPEGYAKRIPKDAYLRFQVHYTVDGTEHWDRPEIALRFAKEPPAWEVITGSAGNYDIELPAGEADYRLAAAVRMPTDARLITLTPHMHYRGKQFRFLLQYPDGALRSLLSMTYDFNWQQQYPLTDELFLPAGSTVLCTGVMDNSAANPWNPDPTVEVRFGRESYDEMFIGYFDYAVPVRAD
jgi:peroxiredoxin